MTILLYDLVGRDNSRPFSPHCWKARMALAHKGLDFESVPTGFVEVPKIENGFARTVPVIRDGDRLIVDSFEIALYLEDKWPDAPTLFGGEGGKAMARFIERWAQLVVGPYIVKAIMMDIFNSIRAEDRGYFRENRESRYKKKLEDIPANRDTERPGLLQALQPLRDMLGYQPFIGGNSPLFSDYIVFGSFQFARIISPFRFLEPDDPVLAWFDRCLDLHDAAGRKVSAAA